jgi:hypothetical protein
VKLVVATPASDDGAVTARPYLASAARTGNAQARVGELGWRF